MVEWILGKVNFKCAVSKFIISSFLDHLSAQMFSDLLNIIMFIIMLGLFFFSQIAVSLFCNLVINNLFKMICKYLPIRDDEFQNGICTYIFSLLLGRKIRKKQVITSGSFHKISGLL